MTVAELIEFLKTQPQDLTVLFSQYSDYTEMEKDMIKVVKACKRRGDGAVQRARPDMPLHDFLLFPGN